MKIISKQSIAEIEKGFIWVKLRTTARKTASQIMLRNCSREEQLSAQFHILSDQKYQILCCWRICMVCLVLELVGPWVELGFGVGVFEIKVD